MGQCCVNQQLQALQQQQQQTQPSATRNDDIDDISKQIDIIRDSGTSSKAPLSNLFDNDINTFWYSDGTEDIFYIIDIGEQGSISQIEITFSHVLYCSDMTFLVPINNDPYDDNIKNWKQIIKKTKMNNGYNNITFNIDANDKPFRYIKLSFDTIKGRSIAGGGQLGVEKLKVFGKMGKIMKRQKTKMYLDENVYNISSEMVAISHSAQFSNSDNIQNIFNTELSYWCSAQVSNNNNVWIIFDCNDCALKEIEFTFHSKYVCKTITVETSDDNNNFKQIPQLTEKSIKQIIFNQSTDVIHKRFIKIIFNQVTKLYLCVKEIKFYGNDPNGNDTAKHDTEQENEEKKQDAKQEEDAKQEDEEEDDYEDITSCFSISLFKDVGCMDEVNFAVKNIYAYDNTYWCSPNRCEMKTDDKDIYLIFDVCDCYIDRIEIMYAANKDAHTNTINIYSCDDITDNGWHKIGQRKQLTHGEVNKIKLQDRNKKYIKIELRDLEDIRFGALSYVKFVGKESDQDNDVTNEVKVCECSQNQFGTDINDIFIKNTKFWASANNRQAWIIFDCKYYEIECIKIKFTATNSKSGQIKIGLSNVKNVYNFKQDDDKLVVDLLENDKERKKLIEEVGLENIYETNGFHRYLIMRFDDNISNVGIQQIRFYGQRCENIPTEILYELDKEEKANDMKMDGIKFGDLPIILVNNSAGFVNPQFKIEHLWSDEPGCWVSEHKAEKVYFTFNLEKYKVKKIEVLLNQRYPCKKCKIFTGDTKLKKEMTLLYANGADVNFNEDPSDLLKARIVDINETNKQFLRFEFSGMVTEFFGLERFKFVGDGLDEESKELRIEDLYEGCDEDLVHKYLSQLGKQQQNELNEAQKIDSKILQKDGDNLGSAEWQKHKKEMLQIPVKYLYLMTQGQSKLRKTQFEEDRHMKFAEKQRELKQLAADRQFVAEVEAMKTMSVSKVKIEKTLKDYQKLLADGKNVKAQKKFMEYQGLLQEAQLKTQELLAFVQGENNKDLSALIADRDKKQVFEAWCDSIDEHPMILSSKYNVAEYESCHAWSLKKENMEPEKVKQRHEKLAAILDESFEENSRKMHKFHMFLLSTTYHFARPPGYNKTCWLLLDCESKKIQRLEIQFQAALQCKKINIYSGARYENNMNVEAEEKKATDDDDMCMDEKWKGFELIHSEVIMPDSNEGGMAQMMQLMAAAQLGANNALRNVDSSTKIFLNGKHGRYLKIEFEDFLMQQFVGIERLKIYSQNDKGDEKEYYDEDFQLKLVQESKKLNSVSGAINIYKKDSDFYWRTRTELNNSAEEKGFIVFETEGKKINKIEFLAEHNYPFHRFTVYQSDNFNQEKDWKQIGVVGKDEIKMNDINTIFLKEKTKRKYIKIEIIQQDESLSYMGMDYIKFSGESASKFINIASQINIVEDSGTFADPNILLSNMYVADGKYIWMNSNELKNPSLDIENKIRDRVCETLNKLRNGGDINKNEKHFCKFLLCWQCKNIYSEILQTAKAVMTILRKPLDQEYQRLIDMKSPILELKLSENDAAKKGICSNREVLLDTFKHWYKFRKAMFYPNDLQKLGAEWVKIGLCDEIPTFKEFLRETVQFNIGDEEAEEKKEDLLTFTDCDELAMDFVNRIAAKLDKSFQQTMKIAFKKNREAMNLKLINENGKRLELGVLSGPIKTKSRQSIKIKLDYNSAPHPRCMSVLDIVRCAIICENDTELVNLFHLLCKQFSGNILRVKNAFHPHVANKSFGYRAILINIIFNDATILPKEYSFICEVQLLLSNYYQVRKKMHLGYGICRSEEGGIAEKKQPYYVLAQDCCKFGTLDI